MNVPSFSMESLPWEEICMFSVPPNGCICRAKDGDVQNIVPVNTSCAPQPLLLVPLESGNTAFVLADSEGKASGKRQDNGNQSSVG